VWGGGLQWDRPLDADVTPVSYADATPVSHHKAQTPLTTTHTTATYHPPKATGSFDETIRFWDVRTGRLLRETPAHSDPVTALAFSFDGTLVVSGSFDGLVRVWDARNGHCLRSYASSSSSAPVNDVVMSHNGALGGLG